MTEDVQRLVEAAGAPDFRYQELRRHSDRTSAAGRWPLLAATHLLLSVERSSLALTRPRRIDLAVPDPEESPLCAASSPQAQEKGEHA